VRATVVDPLQYGYRVVVPRGAVCDRDPAAHRASLTDIDATATSSASARPWRCCAVSPGPRVRLVEISAGA
jgi:Isochorismatase family